MVDLIPLRKKFTYVSLRQNDTPEGRHYVYGEQKLPSVTTILSATKEDREGWSGGSGSNQERGCCCGHSHAQRN